MVLTPDRERLKTLLIETITLLCKNGLDFRSEFSVDALIGITLDQNDVFLVSIKETVKSALCNDQDEGQYNESSTEQFSDSSLPRNADYPKISTSQESMNHRSHSDDTAAGNDSNLVKLPSVAVSRRKTRPCFSSKNNKCLQDVPVASPCTEDEILDLENVFPNVSPQKNPNIPENVAITSQEPPRKRQRGASPTLGKSDEGNSSHKTVIQDLVTQCKSEPLDVIKLEESPIGPEAESADRQENSDFLYGAMYNSELSLRLDTSYTNWYGQDGLVNPGTVPGCSSWPNNSTPTSGKLLQDQVVELVPGSGVCISAVLFDEIEREENLKGSRLVRRLVYDIFPDEQLLATSSCLGKGYQSSRRGLDLNKVDAIKAFVHYKCPTMKERDIVQTINWICGNTRKRLRDRFKRLAQGYCGGGGGGGVELGLD